MENFALGLGVGTLSSQGQLLQVYYNAPLHQAPATLVQIFADIAGYAGGNATLTLDASQLGRIAQACREGGFAEQADIAEILQGSDQAIRLCILASDTAPEDTAQAYLKLTLLSHRLLAPHTQDLSGIFAVLPNVAWTDEGAIALEDLPRRQLQARADGRVLQVWSVDKFPKMLDYVAPSGVRVADGTRVRLGAHLGEGTTVMHEGFVNFNAGTHGVSMVEGRISAGVVVGHGSDVGGGASIMGTLSGGGKQVISMGEQCLLGANAGLGIPLGDRCTVEAGLYLTAGAKVTLLDEQRNEVQTVKASALAGQSDLLFMRNSQNGRIEVRSNKSAVELNDALHKHN